MYQKGDVIICPECSNREAELLKDKYIGDILTASDIKPINESVVYTNGDVFSCSKCGSDMSNRNMNFELKIEGKAS